MSISAAEKITEGKRYGIKKNGLIKAAL